MDLLGQLLQGAKKAEIQDGITENCVVLSVSNDKRKNKDNEVIKRNTYIKFGKLDDKGNITAEREISYFNIQHDSDYAYDNLFEQLFQMTTIAESLVDAEDVDEAFNSVFEECEIKNVQDLQVTAKSKSGLKEFMDMLSDSFVSLLKKKVGKDSKRVKLKLTYGTKGRYIQQPKYGQFVESQDVPAEESKLKMSSKELEYKNKSLQTSTAGSGAPLI